jgi:predicted nucleic acid-binding protein
MNSNERPKYALDSFAMLCWLNDEDGADIIEKLLEKSRKREITLFINWINIGEVYYIVQRKDSQKKAIETISLIKQLPIERVGYEEPLVLLAGDYKANYPISYAEAYCLATAKSKEAKIVTGDPEYECIEDKISIAWLPKKK